MRPFKTCFHKTFANAKIWQSSIVPHQPHRILPLPRAGSYREVLVVDAEPIGQRYSAEGGGHFVHVQRQQGADGTGAAHIQPRPLTTQLKVTSVPRWRRHAHTQVHKSGPLDKQPIILFRTWPSNRDQHIPQGSREVQYCQTCVCQRRSGPSRKSGQSYTQRLQGISGVRTGKWRICGKFRLSQSQTIT